MKLKEIISDPYVLGYKREQSQYTVRIEWQSVTNCLNYIRGNSAIRLYFKVKKRNKFSSNNHDNK